MFPHSTCMLFNGKSNNNWKFTVIPEDVSLNRQQQVSFYKWYNILQSQLCKHSIDLLCKILYNMTMFKFLWIYYLVRLFNCYFVPLVWNLRRIIHILNSQYFTTPTSEINHFNILKFILLRDSWISNTYCSFFYSCTNIFLLSATVWLNISPFNNHWKSILFCFQLKWFFMKVNWKLWQTKQSAFLNSLKIFNKLSQIIWINPTGIEWI